MTAIKEGKNLTDGREEEEIEGTERRKHSCQMQR